MLTSCAAGWPLMLQQSDMLSALLLPVVWSPSASRSQHVPASESVLFPQRGAMVHTTSVAATSRVATLAGVVRDIAEIVAHSRAAVMAKHCCQSSGLNPRNYLISF